MPPLSLTDDTPMTQRVAAVFAERGLRVTRQRRLVYQALAQTTDHPTADEIYHRVGGEAQGISLATVYNTLEALCRAGLAQKLADGGSSARYDARVDDHLHLRDSLSGRVSDVPQHLSRQVLACIPRNLIDQIETETGYTIDRIQIGLVGAPHAHA